ncbi:Trypsin [Corynebacterium cystitidis DSM 20524]|uniref:Trypsin n=1 Tax=Corynebacterium cystitidis DSM 20524 TaxID=1121357 RepID=A0A1H9PRM3_9CORY|nr:Trypsin [Corynebacterium cystitidis DSM 20524]SER50439.1 Trypsin [Corynebacterium cystitidis DSM 20524]SNV75826.1 trypsin-like serine protease [Corynebacterium cystitidis]
MLDLLPWSPVLTTVLPTTLARITNGRTFCSGVLIDASTALTCAHFFRESRHNTYVWVAGVRRVPRDIELIDGTDLAIVHLPPITHVAAGDFPTFGSTPTLLTPTVTAGFGGTVRGRDSFRLRRGWFLARSPIAVSRGMATVVRPAGFILNANPAIKGDSGGPVYAGGQLIGVQSLIFTPAGINLRIATTALLEPIVDQLRAHTDQRRQG